jgi:preprotein translocase subunit YajC
MDAKASKRLRPGDRVRFSDGVAGEVVSTGSMAVEIKWEDGQLGCIHHDDMQDVSRDLALEMSR